MFSEIHPELHSVVRRFVAGVEDALGKNFVGAYLVGSLASGDFDLDSDVDFLVVTETELTGLELRLLQANHIEIHALSCYPAKHLEGSYISKELLKRSDLVGIEPLWYVDNGSTALERSVHDNQWHVRWILRERGIMLAGPKARTLLDTVPSAALRCEAVSAMNDLCTRFLADIEQPAGWFNMRFGQSFAVLTACRMLQTLQTGEVQSKLAAVKWSERFIAPCWHELIRKAWNERVGVRFGEKDRQPADTGVVQETAKFLEYARSLCSMHLPGPHKDPI